MGLRSNPYSGAQRCGGNSEEITQEFAKAGGAVASNIIFKILIFN